MAPDQRIQPAACISLASRRQATIEHVVAVAYQDLFVLHSSPRCSKSSPEIELIPLAADPPPSQTLQQNHSSSDQDPADYLAGHDRSFSRPFSLTSKGHAEKNEI
jgi:hypothetical protein